MYKTFIDRVNKVPDSTESSNILEMPTQKEMWIVDSVIDLHIRNLIETYGSEAFFDSVNRLAVEEKSA